MLSETRWELFKGNFEGYFPYKYESNLVTAIFLFWNNAIGTLLEGTLDAS